MADIKNVELENIKRLKELVEELTMRDEQIFREHGIFEQIVRLVLDGIWIIDENFTTVFVNDKMCTMLGYIPAEIRGENMLDFMPKESDKEVVKKSVNKKKYKIGDEHVFKLKRKDGKHTSTMLTSAPLIGQNKKHLGSIVCVKEITNDEILNYYKQVFFDVSLDVLLITDGTGIIQDVNYQFCSTLEFSRKEVIGQHFLNFVCEQDKKISNEMFYQLMVGGDLLIFQNSLVAKNDINIPIAWRAKPVLENELIFISGRRI